MVHCTETEPSDGNEADPGSELSDNDECRQREQPPAAAENRVNKGLPSLVTYLTLTYALMLLAVCRP